MRLRRKGSQPVCGLIGKHIRIARSSIAGQEGLEGRVVDETRNTLVVESAGRMRRLLKNAIVLELSERNMLVDGKKIMRRPEDR